MSQLERIAFLGLGAMGRRMASRLVTAGHPVVAWSRSGVPAELGALHDRAVATPRAAASEASIVIAMVTDDQASRDVWADPAHGALVGVRAGTLVVECSTLSPARITELAKRATAAGALFLDAPVVGSRPQADAGALTFLVGGAVDAVERARPVLLAMGGAVCHVGPSPAGAMMKLLVNALFGVQVAAVAELLGFARRAGLSMAAVVETLATLPVLSPAAKGAAGSMIAGSFEPQFPGALAAKDLGYVLGAAAAAGGDLPVTARVHEVFAAANAQGLGAEHLTAVAKLYL